MSFRVLFSISILAWSLSMNKPALMVGLLLFYLLLLIWLGQGTILLYRSFKLLFWLYTPILILHGLFTPGIYIQSPVYIPLSVDGLSQGFYLCMHITLMFFAAILVFKVMKRSDFYSLIDMHPVIGNHVKPYVLLLMQLQKGVLEIISENHQQWKAMGSKWFNLPDMLIESIQSVLRMGKFEAKSLWKHWDERFATDIQQSKTLASYTKYEVYYAVFTVIGWVVLYYG